MYINDCLNFMNEERKANQKELYRLLNLPANKHGDEGDTISGATLISQSKIGMTFNFPNQFTKIREENKVLVFRDGQKEGLEAEVVSIDYLTHQIVLTGFYEENVTYLIIRSSDIMPFAIISHLKKLIEQPTDLVTNIIERTSDLTVYDKPSVSNIIKTVMKMDREVLCLQAGAGTGKTYTGKAIINKLLESGKRVMVTSNSHSAINNICDEIEFKDFKGLKIISKGGQESKHESIESRGVSGKNIDTSAYQLVAGTCFALCRMGDSSVESFDYLIVDEASQLKASFAIAASRFSKNLILLGDQLQLSTISCLGDDTKLKGGESILNYMLQDHQIIPKEFGYFLDTTYRMEPQIAKVVSDVFYQGKMKWHKKDKKQGLNLVTVDHKTGQKISLEEAQEIVKIYKSLRRKKVPASEIMIISPYNAQVALIKSLIKNTESLIGTVDLVQGREASRVLISMVSAGNKKQSSEFSTEKKRLNVAISRAKDEVFLIASPGLIKSKDTSKEFQKLIKIIS